MLAFVLTLQAAAALPELVADSDAHLQTDSLKQTHLLNHERFRPWNLVAEGDQKVTVLPGTRPTVQAVGSLESENRRRMVSGHHNSESVGASGG
jgi:hypothetical protein